MKNIVKFAQITTINALHISMNSTYQEDVYQKVMNSSESAKKIGKNAQFANRKMTVINKSLQWRLVCHAIRIKIQNVTIIQINLKIKYAVNCTQQIH